MVDLSGYFWNRLNFHLTSLYKEFADTGVGQMLSATTVSLNQ